MSGYSLARPWLWFPLARSRPREIHLFSGPTNSGKTHAALEELAESPSGLYLGPLRLLAHEVMTRVSATRPCGLVTGQERVNPGLDLVSMTVEMLPVDRFYDTVVVDEAQLCADADRGWAWSRAILGAAARRIIVCGDGTADSLIKELAQRCGDRVVAERRFERRSRLAAEGTPLGSLRQVRAGDCVVAFSRKDLFRHRRELERLGHEARVVYGALPPETRVREATIFNNSADEAVLCASDAIGLGLNLNIRRVVFSTLLKFDGQDVRSLTASEIRQIAGRAGRGHTDGLATAMSARDLAFVRAALKAGPAAPIVRASLLPERGDLIRHAELSGKSLPSLLRALSRSQARSNLFFLSRLDDMIEIADRLAPIRALSLDDRFTFCISPCSTRTPEVIFALTRFAASHARGSPLDVSTKGVLHTPKRAAALKDLEAYYQALDLYVWLSNRFAGSFPTPIKAKILQEKARVLIHRRLDQGSGGG